MDRDERKTRNRMKTNKLKQEKYLESKLGQEQETKFRKNTLDKGRCIYIVYI